MTTPHTVEIRPYTALDVDAEFARIVDELTRRGFLTGAAGTAALFGLAACGSPANPTDSSAGAATRTIDTPRGPVQVPVHPKRVVFISNLAMYCGFDLGVTAIGSTLKADAAVPARYAAQFAKAKPVGTPDSSPDFEAIAALHPDLIIGLNTKDWIYPQLDDVAPTVYMPHGSGVGWRDSAAFVADALNRPAGLDRLKKQYAGQITQIKDRYGDVIDKYTWDAISDYTGGQWWIVGGPGDGNIGDMLLELGIRLAKASASLDPEKQENPSYERLGMLDDAGVLLYWINDDGTPIFSDGQLLTNRLYRRLPAVEAGRSFGFKNMSIASYGQALDALSELESILAKLQTH